MIFFSKIFKKNRKKIDTRHLVQRRRAVRLYIWFKDARRCVSTLELKKLLSFAFCLLSFLYLCQHDNSR